MNTTLFIRTAREHGIRCAIHLRTIDRAMAITKAQGSPCVSDADLAVVARQAWANAKLAAHAALIVLEGGQR